MQKIHFVCKTTKKQESIGFHLKRMQRPENFSARRALFSAVNTLSECGVVVFDGCSAAAPNHVSVSVYIFSSFAHCDLVFTETRAARAHCIRFTKRICRNRIELFILCGGLRWQFDWNGTRWKRGARPLTRCTRTTEQTKNWNCVKLRIKTHEIGIFIFWTGMKTSSLGIYKLRTSTICRRSREL